MSSSTATGPDVVLREMRSARRKNRGAQRDWIDAWYELWLRGFFAIVVIVVVPIILTGNELGPKSIVQFRDHAPGVASIIVALGLWVALRAGAGGAPLAPAGPDVMYLLLAPLPRARVLRPLAANQLRTAVTGGAIVGAATGLAAAARLPSGPGVWALCGLVAGPCLAAAFWGAVAVASARRLRPLVTDAIGAVLVAGAVADAFFHTWIAPSTWLASLTLLPLHGLVPPIAAAAGIAFAIAVPVAALIAIGGTSIEPLLHRSALTSQLRFAASLQDMRTVVLLHRQLASEKSRSRPWLRLPTRATVRRPVWRRGWHGYLRWPIDRVVRVLALLGGAVALTYAARSTHLLIIVAGSALFVAALDVVEPFGAELDHPTSLLTYGVSIRAVLLRNLAAPIVALTGVALVGAGIVTAATGEHVMLIVACAISASLAALAGSALNVALGPPTSELAMVVTMPEVYGLILLVRQGLPPAIAIGGLAPIAVASASGDVAAVAVAVGVSALSVGVLLYSALRGV
jgi:hypothetical protein